MKRAFIVVDLGFGDAGKGLVTDALVREYGARAVVRFNGGAQAGHTVVLEDGRFHRFSQFGAGSFHHGVLSFLGPQVVIHPTAIVVEARHLAAAGVSEPFRRLRICEEALVTTPWHQSLGRLRELARGTRRHGSCGVGVGETVRDAIDAPQEAIRARDLANGKLLAQRARTLRERLEPLASQLVAAAPPSEAVQREWELFHDPDVLQSWVEEVVSSPVPSAVRPESSFFEELSEQPVAVFEGAQGVLLDEWRGFHPYTTWSRCTPEEALRIVRVAGGPSNPDLVGVVRSHAVRHGPGPLPTETPDLIGKIREHNAANPWQGPVRYGWFDGVLMRYAIDCLPGLDRLVVTHMDVAARCDEWRVCEGYALPGSSAVVHRLALPLEGVTLRQIPVRPPLCDLSRQQALTELLFAARPLLEPVPASSPEVLASIHRVTGAAPTHAYFGPTAQDLKALDSD